MRRQQAFSLVEVVLAIGVCSFCLLVLISLMPTGLRSVEDSTHQTMALNIGTGIVSDLRTSAAYMAANPTAGEATTGIETVRYQVTIPTSQTSVQYSLYLDEFGNKVNASKAEFIAILTMIPQTVAGQTGGGLPKPAILAQILIGWPGAANPSLSFTQTYTPGNPGTDMRASLKNLAGKVEIPGAVDLEQ